MKITVYLLMLVVLTSFAYAEKCPDINKNSVVDFDDYFFLVQRFNSVRGDSKYDAAADYNDDGTINFADYLVLSRVFGKQCEQAPQTAKFTSSTNTKNKEMYHKKQVFLVSDKDWKTVLQLVPLTTWTVPEGHPDLEWCNKLKNEDGTVKVFNEKDENGNDVKNYICGYPTLIYHEEEPLSGLTLDKEKFIAETKMLVSWNFKNNVLAEGNVDSDEFTISFNLPDDMYDKLKKGLKIGHMNLKISKIDPNGKDETSYDIFVNGVQLNNIRYSTYGDWIGNVFCNKEGCLLKKGVNQLKFKKNGGNIIIKEYKLFIPYFAIDDINDDCQSKTDDSRVYDLCIKEIKLSKEYISIGETITYTIVIENNGDEIVDLSGEDYVFQGPSDNPSGLGSLFTLPYEIFLSHISTSPFPKVKLGPGKTTRVDVELVFNKLENVNRAFDADSIIYFMQQYAPTHVAITGEIPLDIKPLNLYQLLVLDKNSNQEDIRFNPDNKKGVGLDNEQITSLNLKHDYFNYWQSYDKVVIVEDDYELGLVASEYASLIGAPLIFEKGDYIKNLSGKYIICVGNPSETDCDEQYSLEELQRLYFDKTNTDKLIMVNPDDLNIASLNKYKTDNTGDIINLYTKTSLASPVLASGKHEMLIPIKSKDYLEIDRFVKTKFYEFYSIPTINSYSCKTAEGCANGFEKKSTNVRLAKNEVSFPFNPALINEQKLNKLKQENRGASLSININFFGLFVNCGKDEVDVNVYNNQKLIGSKTVNCRSKEDILLSDSGSLIFLSDLNAKDLSPGEITLKFDGELILVNEYNFDIYVSTVNEEGTISSIQIPYFHCGSFDEECAPDIEQSVIEGYVAQDSVFFNLEDIDVNKDYRLYVNGIVGKEIDKINVYVGKTKVGSYSRVFYSPPRSFIKLLPKELISNKMQVKIEPVHYEGARSPIYAISSVKLEEISHLPYYLTIVASPDSIPMYRNEDRCVPDRVEIDGRLYGSLLENERYIDLSVGRIMGVSTSDVSGYIARSLFFNDLLKNRNALIVIREAIHGEVDALGSKLQVYGPYNEVVLEKYARENFWTDKVRAEFLEESFYSGHGEVKANYDIIYDKYKDNYLLLFEDHGNDIGFSGMMDSNHLTNNKVKLEPSTVIGSACSTCHYNQNGREFCVQGIRRGVMAQNGAVTSSYWSNEFDDVLERTFLEGKSIGEAYKYAKNEEYDDDPYTSCKWIRGDPHYVLLGDPSFKPRWWR